MKIKWKNADAPTGRFRSFQTRGWPSARYEDDRPAALIECGDSYIPSRVKTGQHGELTLLIAFYSTTIEQRAIHGAFRWFPLRQRFKTLKEAKAAAEDYLSKNYVGRTNPPAQ